MPTWILFVLIGLCLLFAFLNIKKPNWKIADLAAILGLGVALIGFALTIGLAKQAKTAADLAKSEVSKVRSDLVSFDVVRSASEALAIFDEIERRFLIEGGWMNLHERYGALYRALGSLRAAPLMVTSAQKKLLVSAQAEVRDIRDQLRSAAMQKTEPKNLEAISTQTLLHADKLGELLEALKNRIGLENG